MSSKTFTKTVISQTMDLNLSKSGSRNEKLSTLCTDIFLIVIKMREAEDLGETAALRKLILHFLRQFEKNCQAVGVAPETADAVKYALVAIMDETVLSVPGEARDLWIVNPMQLEIYGDNIAGQEFYKKLETMLEDPEKNRDALEVYYLCLSLGFEGKYKIGNAEEREKTISDLARVLIKMDNSNITALSPHALRLTVREKRGVKRTGLLPLWLWGGSLAALLAAAWFVLRNITSGSVENLARIVGG
ncbi:MAG: type IVB secretion system protein IcmH/DotU [Chitinispirillaceae bacterium]